MYICSRLNFRYGNYQSIVWRKYLDNLKKIKTTFSRKSSEKLGTALQNGNRRERIGDCVTLCPRSRVLCLRLTSASSSSCINCVLLTGARRVCGLQQLMRAWKSRRSGFADGRHVGTGIRGRSRQQPRRQSR